MSKHFNFVHNINDKGRSVVFRPTYHCNIQSRELSYNVSFKNSIEFVCTVRHISIVRSENKAIKFSSKINASLKLPLQCSETPGAYAHFKKQGFLK